MTTDFHPRETPFSEMTPRDRERARASLRAAMMRYEAERRARRNRVERFIHRAMFGLFLFCVCVFIGYGIVAIPVIADMLRLR